MRLDGKLAVITAAASGMGRAGCEVFAREGATVVGIDVNAQALQSVVAGIAQSGGRAHAITADLSKADESRRAIREAIQQLGGIDILWCHAGTPGPSGLEGIDLDAYRFALDLNLTCTLVMTGETTPHMRKRGGGSIIYTSSVGGLVGSPTSPIYSAAKFGVVGMAKSAAQELARDNIRVNAICPGAIETPMHLEFMARGAGSEVAAANKSKVLASIPMGRVGRPEEVAHAALWLASDEATYVTGVALPVDGGYTCR
jgi:NAD(P)-dependent dehydrogenase (short-subunit alcohol dehydrogenase family)